MREEAAILFANEALYQAFADGDYPAMRALWAEQAGVSCIHPGWEPLFGREAVLESWRAILADPPPIHCSNARVEVLGSSALVLCFETIRGNHLIATNVFTLEDGAWRLVHHQAGPTRGVPRSANDPPGPRTVN